MLTLTIPQQSKKILLALFLIICLPLLTFAQPAPCDMENAEMTPTCIEACVICDIDGFTGRHESDVQGVLPSDFCTMQVHNGQWIAFQAASTELTIRLSVSNCQFGDGLELGIYESLDCQNFNLISNCLGARDAVPEGTSAEFRTIAPLTIGQHYYLAMDGNRGDNCDWTFEVLEGSTTVGALTDTAPIDGLDRYCTSTAQVFSVVPEEGSVLFDWTLDGAFVEQTQVPSLSLSIDEPAIYELCVQAKNTCDEATPSCKEIEIYKIPVTEVSELLCDAECLQVDGYEFCEDGIFEYSIPLANGCDSVIQLTLIAKEQPINNLMVNICEGDTLFIGDIPHASEGAFSDTLQSELFCDSIVNLNLRIVLCNIQSSFTSTSNTCFGDADGAILFEINNGSPPFTYTWQHLQTNITGTGQTGSLLEENSIDGLPAGEVIIEISDEFGNMDILFVVVRQPDPIQVVSENSNFNGFNTSCNASEDGQIDLSANGGMSPFTYLWSTGDIGSSLQNLSAGSYETTLTDALGCVFVHEVTLTEPTMLEADVIFQNPNCSGLESGEIIIQSLTGGVGPYQHALNDGVFSSTNSYTALPPNQYTLNVQDANQCLIQLTNELVAPQIPELSGLSDFQTQLGCEVQILASLNNIDVEQISWLDESYLGCGDCLSPVATPLNSGENILYVTSIDNCTDSLTFNFNVQKDRAFYAPNAFNPNGHPANRLFSLFGGKEVHSIDLLVFDKWGSQVFVKTNMEPVDYQNGWDGTFRGKLSEVGVYVWVAHIAFIDGYTETFGGDITLMK